MPCVIVSGRTISRDRVGLHREQAAGGDRRLVLASASVVVVVVVALVALVAACRRRRRHRHHRRRRRRPPPLANAAWVAVPARRSQRSAPAPARAVSRARKSRKHHHLGEMLHAKPVPGLRRTGGAGRRRNAERPRRAGRALFVRTKLVSARRRASATSSCPSCRPPSSPAPSWRGLLRAAFLARPSSRPSSAPRLRGLLALAAADLALLARDVAVAVEVVEVLAVVHLDAGGGDLRGLALRLARLLPGRRPDVAALDVVHHVVVTLDSSFAIFSPMVCKPSLGVIGCANATRTV